MNAETRRMLWRCRRGLLELDIVLQRFVARHFETLTQPQLEAFDALLGYTDNELWDLLARRSETDDVRVRELLDMMRGAASTRFNYRIETEGGGRA